MRQARARDRVAGADTGRLADLAGAAACGFTDTGERDLMPDGIHRELIMTKKLSQEQT